MFFRMVFYFNVYLNLFFCLFFYIIFKHFLKIISGENTLAAAAWENYNFNINSVTFN